MKNEFPRLTVAICTHNRADLLAEALEALTRQTERAFEMLVVDNGSSDGTETVARAFSSRFPRFRYIREETLGLSHARNAALRDAETDWVCFLDDDALAAPDYMAIALPVCMEASFACFGGVILPWRRAPLPSWFLDEYETGAPRNIRSVSILPEGSFVFGNNMIMRRQVALDLGGFDPSYGMRGNLMAYGEETDLQAKMMAAGQKIGFVPNLVVRHYARPEKYTIRRQLEIRFRSGQAWQMICRDASLASLGVILTKLPASPAKGAALSFLRLVAGSYRWQNAVIETAGRLLFNIGSLCAWIAMRRGDRS